MNLTARRWYPLLLLRNSSGRFAQLRTPRPPRRPAPRRARRFRVQLDAVQLVLF